MIDTACARTLAGTRWFEKFEVELKKHATTVEVVPDSETLRFGLGGSQEKFSSCHFPCGFGTDRVPIVSKLSGRGRPLVGQYGSVEAIGECD